MEITFEKTGTRLVYTKGSNPSVNIVIAQILEFEKSIANTDLIIVVSGKDILIRMTNEAARDTAFELIEDQFA